jgi:hypothetical protein
MMCVEMSGKEQFEHNLLGNENEFVGKRVRFKAVNDARSNLRFIDLGTIASVTNSSNWNGRQTKLWIRWDKDGHYALMDNINSLDVFKEGGLKNPNEHR